mmetsp:Transcript_81795/g.243982  ORF Transcript_81795/g.243982 Transcript_81795/m.243982 type:complete len:226 (-) Transcript_81795:130-807(-)
MSKSHEHHLGYSCGCVPVWCTVLIYAVFMLLLSLAAALSLVTEDFRTMVGGYSLVLRTLVSVLGGIGTFFSVGAIIGINDNCSGWVRPFLYYVLVRVVVVLVFFVIDWRELQGCEHYTISGGKFTSVDGGRYNPAIETVALADMCSQARTAHAIYTALDVLIALYGAYTVHHWCHMVDVAPTYRIALDETRPLRIYTGFANVGYENNPPPDHMNAVQSRYAEYNA